MHVRISTHLPLACLAFCSVILPGCGGGGGSSASIPAPNASSSPLADSTLPNGHVAPTPVPAITSAPNYLGYVSWFWGDQNTWTINCDKPSYFAPNTCLPVHVQSGAIQIDGPPLGTGVFVAIYADPKTANATTGLTALWFRTSKTPFAGSPLPNGYTATVAPTAAPTVKPTVAPTIAPTIAPTVAPTVAPTEKPTVAPTIPPPAPVVPPVSATYAQLYSSASPFRTAVAQHKANGATTLPASATNALWNQGIAYEPIGDARQLPIYAASASDPLVKIRCTAYGGGCYGSGTSIHVPAAALHQQVNSGDNHILVVDQSLGLEWDGWQCANATATCSWGSLYALGTNGLHGPGNHPGNEGVHGGYAVGLFSLQPAEIAQGHIDHALGLNVPCLNDPTVYPADTQAGGSDESCGGNGPPAYGDLLHLTWTPARIAASAYSAECKTVLTAFATYGAYTYDTGNTPGIELQSESSLASTAFGLADPWATIRANMRAAGDSDGTNWSSCLNRLHASDFELLQIPAGNY